MSWLSGVELESLIRTYADDDTTAAFLGIFSRDTLPTSIQRLPVLFVVNTQTSNLPGQHWVAVYISSEKRGELFDSLATPVSLKLMRWMNTFTVKWRPSKMRIQNPLSAYCGAFVAYFVLTRLKAKSMEACLQLFTKDLSFNDQLIQNFVKTLKI